MKQVKKTGNKWTTVVTVITSIVMAVTVSVYSPVHATDGNDNSAGSEANYVSGEVIVTYNNAGLSEQKTEAVAATAEQSICDAGGDVVEEISGATSDTGTMVVAEIPEELTVEEAVKEISDLPGVEAVQPNFIYHLMDEPLGVEKPALNDPEYSNQYYISSIKADKAWMYAKAEGQQTVVVMDTGCRLNHKDLRENILLDKAYDAAAQKQLTIPEDGSSCGDSSPIGHGTHVCGIIAAEANNGIGVAGVSYNAKILPINVFGPEGALTSDIITAFNYVESLKDSGELPNCHVMNLSFGYYTQPDSEMDEEDTLLENAIIEARNDYNILCVCSGGNSPTIDCSPYDCHVYPADFDAAIAVTGLTADNKNVIGWTYGPDKDISAPAKSIRSTTMTRNDTYGDLNGTSMATPEVSGVAALMWAADPELTVDEAVDIMKSNATPIVRTYIPDVGANYNGSAGKINAEACVVQTLKAAEKDVQIDISSSFLDVSLSKKLYKYDGYSHRPRVTITNTLDGTELVAGEDYQVSYANNVSVGRAKAIIEGLGKYEGQTAKLFSIYPKGNKILKIRGYRGAFYVKWTRQKALMKKSHISGYQIAYKRAGTSTWHKYTVKGYTKNAIKLAKLKRHKKYYVKVRTYKSINGVRYCSKWSKSWYVRTK